MLALVAAVVLVGSEPSAASLAPRFVQVQAALPGEQPTVEAPPPEPYVGWTRGQLELELLRLEDLRPSLGLPIALLASGAAIAVIDFVVFFFAGFLALVGGTGLPVPVTAGIVVAALIAVGMIVIGAILISRTVQDRKQLGVQIDLVRAAIDKLRAPADPVPPAPSPDDPPPPPPPAFPQQVLWAPSLVTVTLARF